VENYCISISLTINGIDKPVPIIVIPTKRNRYVLKCLNILKSIGFINTTAHTPKVQTHNRIQNYSALNVSIFLYEREYWKTKERDKIGITAVIMTSMRRTVNYASADNKGDKDIKMIKTELIFGKNFDTSYR
jgi:hypothetical protein